MISVEICGNACIAAYPAADDPTGVGGKDVCDPSSGFTMGNRGDNSGSRYAAPVVQIVWGIGQYASRFTQKADLSVLWNAAGG